MRSLTGGRGPCLSGAGLLSAAALTACVAASRAPRAPLPIHVENMTFQPVTLYLRVEDGELVRLGDVEAASRTTFSAPLERLRRGVARLVIRSRAGESTMLDERLELIPGELLRVRLVQPWMYSAVLRQR